MKNLNVEVDEDELGALTTETQDRVVEFFQLAPKIMSETGGAIPLIVNNGGGWKDQLESSVCRKLDAIDNGDNSVSKQWESKLTEIFGDCKIRIFGNKRSGHISSRRQPKEV